MDTQFQGIDRNFKNTVIFLVAVGFSFFNRTFALPENKSMAGPNPPVIITGSHVSLNAIKVTWTEPETENLTHMRSFTTVLSETNCSAPMRQQKLPGDVVTWTFWDVDAAPSHVICVRISTPEGTSEWASVSTKQEEKRPPWLVTEPPREKIFLAEEDVKIPCRAEGTPAPEITWTKDGDVLDLESGRDFTYDSERGELVIGSVTSRLAGFYACSATNQYGSAQSSAVLLKEAVLLPFPADEQHRTYSVAPGDSLRIECRAPFSVPRAIIRWSRIRSLTDPEPRRVKQNQRIIIMDDGSLVFVHAVDSDKGMYQCEVHNIELDQTESGSYSVVEIEGDGGFYFPPQILSSSPEKVHALIGGEATFQCIFGGRPAPVVMWYRAGRFPTRRHQLGPYNYTLTVRDVRLGDEGLYECQGSNTRVNKSQGKSQPVRFQLLIYASPSWVEKPQSRNLTVGEDAVFRCAGRGVPDPAVEWRSNGAPLSGLSGEKYSVSEDGEILTVYNVTKDDMMNVQCNVSNVHGYIYADSYINVVLPTRIVSPPRDQVLRLHGVVRFECAVESDPGTFLKLQWLRSGKPVVEDEGRIYVDAAQSLVINSTNEEDGGKSFIAKYTCQVDNGVEVVRASARLRPPPHFSGDPILAKVAHQTPTSLKELMWIGAVCALAALVLVCVVLLLVARKKSDYRMRSGTDTSMLSHLTAAAAKSEEEQALACDTPALPGLPHCSDDQLKEAIQEVFILRSRIELGSLIGKGTFGRVYAGMLKDGRGKSTARIAVKTLKYKADETEVVELFLREAVMMKDFRHPHVLSLIGISVEMEGSPMVVLPYMAYGDLRRYIQDPQREITVLELLRFGLQAAKGMAYLGAMRFVHRDLATRNCMVDANMAIKVADFGLSRDLFSRDYYRLEDRKTPLPVRWMAPECFEANVFTIFSDVWSYGVLLWELMTRGAVPYPDVENWDVGRFIQSDKRLDKPPYCPDSVYDIMMKCWSHDPDERPSFDAIVRELDAIILTGRNVDSSASHLYLNIHTVMSVSDYRDISA